jgi:hypothetical protein
MPLFWRVNETDGARRVFIQELIFARLHAGIAGFDGVFVEALVLDEARVVRSRSQGAARSHVVMPRERVVILRGGLRRAVVP